MVVVEEGMRCFGTGIIGKKEMDVYNILCMHIYLMNSYCHLDFSVFHEISREICAMLCRSHKFEYGCIQNTEGVRSEIDVWINLSRLLISFWQRDTYILQVPCFADLCYLTSLHI